MNYAALKSDTHEIVVDEVLPHAPETKIGRAHV